MRTEFSADPNVKRKVLRRIARHYKRYTVGIVISAVFLVAAIVALAIVWFIQRDLSTSDKTLATIEILILPAIVIGISSAVAFSGGRGEWMLRCNEKIVVENGFVTYSFAELSPSGIAKRAGTTDISIPFDDIRRATYNEKMCRVELLTDYVLIKQSPEGSIIEATEHENVNLPIMMYFSNTEKLKAILLSAGGE